MFQGRHGSNLCDSLNHAVQLGTTSNRTHGGKGTRGPRPPRITRRCPLAPLLKVLPEPAGASARLFGGRPGSGAVSAPAETRVGPPPVGIKNMLRARSSRGRDPDRVSSSGSTGIGGSGRERSPSRTGRLGMHLPSQTPVTGAGWLYKLAPAPQVFRDTYPLATAF